MGRDAQFDMNKATVNKPKRRKKPKTTSTPKPGFGVLVIPDDARIVHGGTVDGGDSRY